MERQVYAGSLFVGDFSPTVQAQVNVRLAQQSYRDSTLFQLFAQFARQSEGDIFFHQLPAKACSFVGAAMAGVNHHKELEWALLNFRRGNAWPDKRRHSRNLGRLRLQRYRLAIIAADDLQILIP